MRYNSRITRFPALVLLSVIGIACATPAEIVCTADSAGRVLDAVANLSRKAGTAAREIARIGESEQVGTADPAEDCEQ